MKILLPNRLAWQLPALALVAGFGACRPATSPATSPSSPQPTAGPTATLEPAWSSELPPLNEKSACNAAAFRGLDFWLGRWRVTLPNGKFLGENRLALDLSGCRIVETWRGNGGGTGSSVNYYDAAQKQWRQIWVDDEGGGIDYTGTADGREYKVEGLLRDAQGVTKPTRMTVTAQADGTVQQRIDESPDGGATWTTTFLGIYTKLP